MVSEDVQTYVNSEGETVEIGLHDYYTQYRNQGYVLKEQVSEDDISNPDVDTSSIEAPAVNAPIEVDPVGQPEERRDRLRG